MPTPEVDSAVKPLVPGACTAKTKNQNIQVSPAVLDAARKDGEELLQSLRTTAQGLTQTEAEGRARAVGPNEVAQERKQGWPLRLLKIIRNPLVILLATLSAISFATGDARAVVQCSDPRQSEMRFARIERINGNCSDCTA